jgi:hypothetical protein
MFDAPNVAKSMRYEPTPITGVHVSPDPYYRTWSHLFISRWTYHSTLQASKKLFETFAGSVLHRSSFAFVALKADLA